MQHGIDLPHGYRQIFYEAIDSTNAEALRQAAMGQEGGLWVWAGEQHAGRGRAGRAWNSRTGGLYASLMLRPHVPLTTALHLPLLAGVAAHDAILSLAAGTCMDACPDVRLKWPNDILIGNAKLGGILLESTSSYGEHPVVVIGTGLNLEPLPDDLGRPIASLQEVGIKVGVAEAFAALAWTTAEWLNRWSNGAGFDLIRTAWQDRAQPLGSTVSVRLGQDVVTGTFLGLDDMGALRLATSTGEQRVTAGDVSLGTEA
jgi:BirA family transcriptional regulator, biotin operon repressor / biotin---[acetyl-CoA-carboxylase] ligase